MCVTDPPAPVRLTSCVPHIRSSILSFLLFPLPLTFHPPFLLIPSPPLQHPSVFSSPLLDPIFNTPSPSGSFHHAFLIIPLFSHYGEDAVHPPRTNWIRLVINAEKLPRLSRPHAPNTPTSCYLSTANDEIGASRFLPVIACDLALNLYFQSSSFVDLLVLLGLLAWPSAVGPSPPHFLDPRDTRCSYSGVCLDLKTTCLNCLYLSILSHPNHASTPSISGACSASLCN